MGDVILQFDGITKTFGGVHALKDVTFALPRGRLLGLIGENGAGKTTLMNILGGVIRQDEGTMHLNGEDYSPENPAEATKAGIAFIHQELNLFTNLSIADNIFIDRFPRLPGLRLINKPALRSRTKELIVSVGLAVSPDTLVEKLAPGERQLVEIAKAISFGAEIIIFDEPTTSLTSRETEQLFKIIEQLRTNRKSIIYISHNLGNVLHLADDVVVLRDGAVVSTGAKCDYTIEKMVSAMVGRDVDRMYPARKARPSSEVAIEVKRLSQSGIVKDISFTLHKGEVLGLFGLMGSGRSELARMVFGLDSFEQGTITVAGRPRNRFSAAESIADKIAFVTENRREEGLLMEASIFDNIALVAAPNYCKRRVMRFVDRPRLSTAVASVADCMRIKTASLDEQLAKNLSGGNQQKAVIAKWLLAKPAVFIMDEPTRGIDVGAKYEIYGIINDLAAEGTAVLFISSELEELMGGCDAILVMSKGEIQGCFPRSEFDQEKILHAAFKGHRKHGNAA
jgi:ribose transport system ATP-binding protein